jgi:hypothetical protein
MRCNLTQKTEVTTELVEEYTFTKKELQHLVDIYFEVVIATATQVVDHKVTHDQYWGTEETNFEGLREKYMRNAAHHLRESCGIDTHPIGSSWGAIVGKEFRQIFPWRKDDKTNHMDH